MNTTTYPIGRKNNLVMQELEKEVLLYDLQVNKAFCLNETSALVWQLCDGTRSINEISRDLSHKLQQPISEEFVWLALDQLKKEKLLGNGKMIELNFKGLSRREVMRKVGMSSMVCIPLIVSIVAPTAIYAQSGSCSGVGMGTAPTGATVEDAGAVVCTTIGECDDDFDGFAFRFCCSAMAVDGQMSTCPSGTTTCVCD